MRRAQIEVEGIFTILLLLILFVVIGLLVSAREEDKKFINTLNEDMSTCDNLSYLVNFLNSNPGNEEITTEILADANVSNGRIFAGEYFCYYYGTATAANLLKGTVRLHDFNGVVQLENI